MVEGWPSGRLEFKVTILHSVGGGEESALGTLTKYPGRNGWITKKLFTVSLETKELDIDLFTFNKDEAGNRYKIHWLEQDWGNDNATFTGNYTNSFEGGGTYTTNFEVHGKNNDDEAGESYVEYVDCKHN